MKVAIVGNCQARPIGNLIKAMCPSVDVLPEIIVHLSNSDLERSELNILDSADIILAQTVHSGYHATHLITAELKKRYLGRVLSWPNLFFTGNSPDLVYVTSVCQTRLVGPLGVYHNKLVFECWRNAIDLSCANEELDKTYKLYKDQLLESVSCSLNEFCRRNDETDVSLAEYVSENWRKRRLFFTFNHPTAELLIVLSKKLVELMGLSSVADYDVKLESEPLDLIVPPTINAIVGLLGLEYKSSEISKGVTLSIDEQVVTTGIQKMYSQAELLKRSYEAYDAQRIYTNNVRFTPRYAV